MGALILAWAVCVVGVSTLLHEFGHAWTARAVGWKVIGLRWRWYGVAFVADTDGKPDELWKVALGGLTATALLALAFLAGTGLPGAGARPLRLRIRAQRDGPPHQRRTDPAARRRAGPRRAPSRPLPLASVSCPQTRR